MGNGRCGRGLVHPSTSVFTGACFAQDERALCGRLSSRSSSLAQDAIAPQAAISIAKARMSPVVVGAILFMA